MKIFCVLAACALLLGCLVARQDGSSPQATVASAQSTEATPSEAMDDKARILAAIEEASRYADFSTGEVIVKVRTTVDSSSTIIEVKPDFIKSDLTVRFLALINTDGSLTHFNQNYSRKEATTAEALVKALEFTHGIWPRPWISEFIVRIRNHADHTDVFLDVAPRYLGFEVALRVVGDEVTIVGPRPYVDPELGNRK